MAYQAVECPYCGTDCELQRNIEPGDSLECLDLQCPIVEFKVFDK